MQNLIILHGHYNNIQNTQKKKKGKRSPCDGPQKSLYLAESKPLELCLNLSLY